jgi:hypothetical protein
MCPFLEDDDDEYDFDGYRLTNRDKLDYENNSDTSGGRLSFLKEDRKFFVIGGIASVATFCAIAYIMYFNTKPIDLDDLPVIKADTDPIKIKPPSNAQVKHQDKVVYDNISGDRRVNVIEKTLPQPEEVLSINEMDADASLSDEEKKNIIQAFDALAPEKEYKINYVRTDSKGSKVAGGVDQSGNVAQSNGVAQYNGVAQSNVVTRSNGLKIVETRDPPLKIVNSTDAAARNFAKNQKAWRKDLIAGNSKITTAATDAIPAAGGSVMVQIASLPTKTSAEVEYKRLLHKNRFLKGVGKKIVRIDLGKSKGITYRIQVGPFKNNAEAQKVVSAMKNNRCPAYISGR